MAGDRAGYGGSSHQAAIAAGTVITFLLYLDQFFAPIQQLSQVFEQQGDGVVLHKIDELMQTPCTTPAARVRRHRAPAPSGSTTSTCTRRPRPRRGRDPARRDVLDLPGETVALVGATGAGKSTIVKLVASLYDVDSGTVSVDGVPVTHYDLGAYRRRLGYVPQEPFLFSGTIRDNVAYGDPTCPTPRSSAPRAVGAHDFVAQLAGGYLHPVTERGGRSRPARSS